MRDDAQQGLESKKYAWSTGTTVAVPKEILEKLWAHLGVHFFGASQLCYTSLLGQLQNPIPCLGLLLPLDIYVRGHTAMHLERSPSHLFPGF